MSIKTGTESWIYLKDKPPEVDLCWILDALFCELFESKNFLPFVKLNPNSEKILNQCSILIEQTERAFTAFFDLQGLCKVEVGRDNQYLVIFGAIQALDLQYKALRKLVNILGYENSYISHCDTNNEMFNICEEMKDIMSDKEYYPFLSLGKKANGHEIILLHYYNDEEEIQKGVDLAQVIIGQQNKNRSVLFSIFNKIQEQYKEKNSKHTFKQLADVLLKENGDSSYYEPIAIIKENLLTQNTVQSMSEKLCDIGLTQINIISEIMSNFELGLEERDLKQSPKFDQVLREIHYSINSIKKAFETPNIKVDISKINIFIEALLSYFRTLKHNAHVVDYNQRESEDVI